MRFVVTFGSVILLGELGTKDALLANYNFVAENVGHRLMYIHGLVVEDDHIEIIWFFGGLGGSVTTGRRNIRFRNLPVRSTAMFLKKKSLPLSVLGLVESAGPGKAPTLDVVDVLLEVKLLKKG